MGRLIRAEWTKFRSVRSTGVALFLTFAVTVGLALLGASESGSDANRHWNAPTGPDGKPVRDTFHFVHQQISGDATITVRVLGITPRVEPHSNWAKAGLIVKESMRPGSQYAAVMLTSGHGVRLQSNYVNDKAGSASGGDRWLRLTRAGNTITGYESADGAAWQQIGTATLASLPRSVEIGLFVASPDAYRMERSVGSGSVGGYTTFSTARFDNVRVEPGPTGEWSNDDIGDAEGDATIDGATMSLSGTGDVAPRPPDDDVTRLSLTGVFLGLIVLGALAIMFMTSEYRRGMIRTTLAAEPRRGRVLVAKAIVIGGAAFVIGLATCLAAFFIAQPILRDSGFGPPAFPKPSLTDPLVWRSLIGTAAVLALLAVFSLSLGAIVRRSAGAITAIVLLVVAPPLLAGALPVSAATWLMRLTPTAGFSIQDTIPRYSHVENICVPEAGCFVTNPWIGLAVVCGYAVIGLLAAYWLLRKRDA